MEEKEKMDLENESEGNAEGLEENYISTGMCFGVAAGCVGMGIFAHFGQTAIGSICIAIGIGAGMMIGSLVAKKKRR